MADLHNLIAKLKELALELGRTPTKVEFAKVVSEYQIRAVGGYTPIVQAAGLEPYNFKDKKIDNSIFKRDIEDHLLNYEPKKKEPIQPIKYTKTVIIGDCHFPFVHQPSLDKIYKIIEKEQPERVIQVGDLYDCMSHSKFPRSLNIYTPKEEMDLARKGAEEMWAKIRSLAKKAQCYQILGNHDIRPMKSVIEKYPEIELFIDFSKWFQFDGVNSEMDIRKELKLDGINYIHGYRGKLGEHMEYMRQPVVCGHTHRAGIVFKNYGDQVLFEMNVGYIGDPESKALSYTAQKHSHSTHAVGLINENGPQVIIL